ncbi:MAG: hypothetical protein NW201_11195, partial [Gemmatimonadales bacterium]|nr:hypothetical protein [Gemmatimonadales bacterium]
AVPAPAPRREAAAPPAPAPPPAVPAAAPERIAFTQAALTAAWPALAEALKRESFFLGTALAGCRVVSVAPPVVRVLPADAAARLPLEQQHEKVEALLREAVGAPVTLDLAREGGEAPVPKRLTGESLKAERLKGLREKDPALDAAAQELDLEIVE